MILSIDSSLQTFKRVEFRDGLNVLLSDSQPGASEKQTRNSAGKTSLIEIIHFLLGADCDKNSLFRTDELIDQTFTGEFDFWGTRLSIERCGSQPSRIFLLRGFDGRDDLLIKHEKDSERPYLSNENWKLMLGIRASRRSIWNNLRAVLYAFFQIDDLVLRSSSEFGSLYKPRTPSRKTTKVGLARKSVLSVWA